VDIQGVSEVSTLILTGNRTHQYGTTFLSAIFLDENERFFHISADFNYPLQYLVAQGYFSEKSLQFFFWN
jgi:hypothetical protein